MTAASSADATDSAIARRWRKRICEFVVRALDGDAFVDFANLSEIESNTNKLKLMTLRARASEGGGSCPPGI